MEVITYSDARNGLARLLKKVTDDGVPVLITRQRGKPVAIISLDGYASLDETAHLLSSPKNAAELKASLRELKAGKGVRLPKIVVAGRERNTMKIKIKAKAQ